jgi:hypothetical protein
MRKFNTIFHGEVDLDDPKTYEFLPQDCKSVIDRMCQEIGYAYCYMEFHHPEVFNIDSGLSQKVRVVVLCNQWCKGLEDNRNNLLWLQEKLFFFLEEIENMC